MNKKNTVIGLAVIGVLVIGLFIYLNTQSSTSTQSDQTEEQHEESEGEKHVELSTEQIMAANIGASEARSEKLQTTLPLYGVIVPNAEQVQQVMARFPGVILRTHKQVGDAVNAGETLAVIESNENLESYPITSKLTGVVTERNANVGEQAGDKVLFMIADLSSVWVEAAVFPHDQDQIQVGQTVHIKSNKINLQAEGRVEHIDPVGNRVNQSQTVHIELKNKAGRWKPGLFVNVEVLVDETSVPLAVRNEAIQTADDSPVVFVRHEEGFVVRPVHVGRRDSEFSEILNGLKAGEVYASKNSFILKSELEKEGAEHGH